MNTEQNHGDVPSEWKLYSLGVLPAEANTSVANETLIIEYQDWQVNVRLRTPRTIEAYGYTLRCWNDWLWPQSLLTATVSQMEAFSIRTRIRRAQGKVGKPGTIRRDTAILRSFYQWAWERDYTQTHIAKGLHSPPVHNVDPKPIPDEHFLAMWNHPKRTVSDIAALGLAYYCGLRRSEILHLQVGMVTPTQIIEFRRKGGMNFTLPWAEMVNVLHAKLPHLVPDELKLGRALGSLVEGRAADEPLLRWSSLGEASFNKRMIAWTNQAGTPRYSPHQARHGCATNLVRAGVPLPLVARMLNHTSTVTTMRYVQAGGRELNEWLTNNQ